MMSQEEIDRLVEEIARAARAQVAAHPPSRHDTVSVRGHDAHEWLAEAVGDKATRERVIHALRRALRPLTETHEFEHLHVGYESDRIGHLCFWYAELRDAA